MRPLAAVRQLASCSKLVPPPARGWWPSQPPHAGGAPCTREDVRAVNPRRTRGELSAGALESNTSVPPLAAAHKRPRRPSVLSWSSAARPAVPACGAGSARGRSLAGRARASRDARGPRCSRARTRRRAQPMGGSAAGAGRGRRLLRRLVHRALGSVARWRRVVLARGAVVALGWRLRRVRRHARRPVRRAAPAPARALRLLPSGDARAPLRV